MRRAWEALWRTMETSYRALTGGSEAERQGALSDLGTRAAIHHALPAHMWALDGRKLQFGISRGPDWAVMDARVGVADVHTTQLLIQGTRAETKEAGTQQLVAFLAFRAHAVKTALGTRTGSILLEEQGNVGLASTGGEVQLVHLTYRKIETSTDRPLVLKESAWLPLIPLSALSGADDSPPPEPSDGFKLLWRTLRLPRKRLGAIRKTTPTSFQHGSMSIDVPLFRHLGAGGSCDVFSCADEDGKETMEIVKAMRDSAPAGVILHEAEKLHIINDVHRERADAFAAPLRIPQVIQPPLRQVAIMRMMFAFGGEERKRWLHMRPRGVPILHRLWATQPEDALSSAILCTKHVLDSLRWVHLAGFSHGDVRHSNMVWVDSDALQPPAAAPEGAAGGGGAGGARDGHMMVGGCYLVDFGLSFRLGDEYKADCIGDVLFNTSALLKLVKEKGDLTRILAITDIVSALYSLFAFADLTAFPKWGVDWACDRVESGPGLNPRDLDPEQIAQNRIKARYKYLRQSELGTAIIKRIRVLFTEALEDLTQAAASVPKSKPVPRQTWYDLDFLDGITHTPVNRFEPDILSVHESGVDFPGPAPLWLGESTGTLVGTSSASTSSESADDAALDAEIAEDLRRECAVYQFPK